MYIMNLRENKLLNNLLMYIVVRLYIEFIIILKILCIFYYKNIFESLCI